MGALLTSHSHGLRVALGPFYHAGCSAVGSYVLNTLATGNHGGHRWVLEYPSEGPVRHGNTFRELLMLYAASFRDLALYLFSRSATPPVVIGKGCTITVFSRKKAARQGYSGEDS